MDYKTLDNILSDAVNDAELCCDDIPSIALYLDQIVNLIRDKSHEGSPRFYDRSLTKTMVNNYSKAGLITPVKGKKYTKEQIVQMLMINSLKNTLSISEIKGAMDGFYACDDENNNLMETYDKYVNMRRKCKVECPELIKSMIENNDYDIENEAEYFGAIFAVVAMADYFESIAHAMLEAVIPQPLTDEQADTREAEKVAEKEVKKETKAVKKEVKKENKAQKKAEKSKSDSVSRATDSVIADEIKLLEKEVDRVIDAELDGKEE